MVYLLHFDKPVGNGHKFVSHYLGYTEDLEARLVQHQRGNGARLMQVCAERGVSWTVARTWQGDRALERRLKRWKRAADFCPLCDAQAMDRALW